MTPSHRIAYDAASTFALIAFAIAAVIAAAVALPGIVLSACERPRCTPIAPAAFWLLVIVLPAAVAAAPCTIAACAPLSPVRARMIGVSVAAVAVAVIAPVVVVTSYV